MSDQSGVAGGIDDTCGTTRRGLRGTSVRRGGLVKWSYWAGAWPTHERLKLLMELGRRALPERIWVKNSSAVAPLYLSESVSGLAPCRLHHCYSARDPIPWTVSLRCSGLSPFIPPLGVPARFSTRGCHHDRVKMPSS